MILDNSFCSDHKKRIKHSMDSSIDSDFLTTMSFEDSSKSKSLLLSFLGQMLMLVLNVLIDCKD